MIVTIFRSHPNPDPAAQQEHEALVPELFELVSAIPGFVSATPFTGADGEQLGLIEFADEASLEAWATHPRHMAAKQLGRERLLQNYRIQICKVIRTSSKPAA